MTDFIDDCIGLVRDKIDSVKDRGENLRLPMNLSLEESVLSTESPDDFYHEFTFSLDYPGDTRRALSVTYTMDENKPVGMGYIDHIHQFFLYLQIDGSGMRVGLQHGKCSDKAYNGAVTIAKQ